MTGVVSCGYVPVKADLPWYAQRMPLRATVLLWLVACASSSSGPNAIVGEWQYTDAKFGRASIIYFDSDGTCGSALTSNNTTTCQYTCTYTYDGSSLTVRYAELDGGQGAPMTATVSVSGNTLMYDGTPYDRVNSNGQNSCP